MLKNALGRFRPILPGYGLLVETGLDKARSLGDAISMVAGLRGHPIVVTERPLLGDVNGMWVDRGDHDEIVVNSSTVFAREHREHVIAHELMHALDAATKIRPGAKVLFRSRYDTDLEFRVEMLACALMISIRGSGDIGARLSSMGTYR